MTEWLQLEMHHTDVIQQSTCLKLLKAAIAAKVSRLQESVVVRRRRRRRRRPVGAVTSGLGDQPRLQPFADVSRSLVVLELGPLGCLEITPLAEVTVELNESLK